MDEKIYKSFDTNKNKHHMYETSVIKSSNLWKIKFLIFFFELFPLDVSFKWNAAAAFPHQWYWRLFEKGQLVTKRVTSHNLNSKAKQKCVPIGSELSFFKDKIFIPSFS